MPPEGASVRPFAWAWLAYAILIFLLAVSFWIPSGLYKDFDFRAMYAAGVLARTDSSHLYDLSRQKQVQDGLVGKLRSIDIRSHIWPMMRFFMFRFRF